jgi:hypothetical protein
MNEPIENNEEKYEDEITETPEIHDCIYEIVKSNEGTYSICKGCGSMILLFK